MALIEKPYPWSTWTTDEMKKLLELCADHRSNAGNTTSIDLGFIQQRLRDEHGIRATIAIIRNKFETVQEDYTVWLSLFEDTQVDVKLHNCEVTAPDWWWESKQTPSYKLIKNGGMMGEIVDLCTALFSKWEMSDDQYQINTIEVSIGESQIGGPIDDIQNSVHGGGLGDSSEHST